MVIGLLGRYLWALSLIAARIHAMVTMSTNVFRKIADVALHCCAEAGLPFMVQVPVREKQKIIQMIINGRSANRLSAGILYLTQIRIEKRYIQIKPIPTIGNRGAAEGALGGVGRWMVTYSARS